MKCSFSALPFHRVAAASIAAAVFVAAAGCSDTPYELAAVSGKVLVDGQPFTQGKVIFTPLAKGVDHMAGRFAIGRVDANGEFTLGTYKPEDGAVVGQHWVTLIRVEPEPDDMGEFSPPKPPGATTFDRLAVPTPVTVVAGEDNRIDINVTKDEVAKLGMRTR
jgi:hypothetical protein